LLAACAAHSRYSITGNPDADYLRFTRTTPEGTSSSVRLALLSVWGSASLMDPAGLLSSFSVVRVIIGI